MIIDINCMIMELLQCQPLLNRAAGWLILIIIFPNFSLTRRNKSLEIVIVEAFVIIHLN